MKLGVFYHHVKKAAEQQEKPFSEMLDYVKSLGIDYLELDRDALSDYGNDADALYEDLKAHGLRGSNLCWYYPWEKDPDDLCDFEMIKAAEKLHLERVMPIPGLYTSEERDPAELANMIRNMNLLSERAKESGIGFCIEDYDFALSEISTMEGMKYFADHIPGLKIAFDTGNFFYVNEDVLEAYELLRDGIIHVHVKDRSLTPDGGNGRACLDGTVMYPCPVGEGVIPVKTLMKQLHEDGYDGVFTMEFYDVPDYYEAIRVSAANMKKYAAEIGI